MEFFFLSETLNFGTENENNNNKKRKYGRIKRMSGYAS